MECVICFDVIGQHNLNCRKKDYVECSNKICTSTICSNCAKSYLLLSNKDGKIPKCVNRKCGMYMLLSNFKHFPELREIYIETCFNALIKIEDNDAKKKLEIDLMIERIVKIREEFLKEKFPRSLSFMAEITFQDRIKNIDKQIINKIEKDVNLSRRKCMNTLCEGSLDINFKCLSCDTQFCKDCERRQTIDHICKTEDLESIDIIKTVVRCPKCCFPIIRSQGCPHMKCINCGEHFDYLTGKSYDQNSGPGNIFKPENSLLSIQHYDFLRKVNLIDLIRQIEELRPPKSNTKILSSILLKYYRNPSNISNIDIVRSFENYIKNVHRNKRYHDVINEVELSIINKTITRDYLTGILLKIK